MSAAYDSAIATVEPTLQIPRLKFGGLSAANQRALEAEQAWANVNLPALKRDYLARNPHRGI